MPRKLQDLTGQRFTRLVVIERAENDKHGNTQWRCKCDCGNEAVVLPTDLKRNRKSCGCLRRETAAKHMAQLSRCYIEGTPEYEKRQHQLADIGKDLNLENLGDLPESLLPRRKAGNQSNRAEALYNLQIDRFCERMREIDSTIDFKVGSRGWCYILEEHGLRKGDFKAAQKLITNLRKTGKLPLDICAEDQARATIGLESLDDDDAEDEADSWIQHLRTVHESYLPISFWDDKDVYLEVGVEKLDLRNLFESVCEEFRVPLTNFKGWSDLNSRGAMMKRFARHEAAGRQCVLLLCGDHDPGGLHITKTMRKNLYDLSGAIGWTIWIERRLC
jgi:hypothetical protein